MLTAELLAPLQTAITSNVTAILPVGLGIMATFVGVKMIPKLIHRFL